MEIAGLIIGIIGIIIAIATYNRQFNQPPPVFPEPEPNAEKENLKAHFLMTQKLSLEVQSMIKEYVDKGHGNKYMFEGITYLQYLNLQKSEFDKCLSDKVYENLNNITLNKHHIDSMLSSVKGQYGALQQIKHQMQIFLAKEN